MLNNPMSDHVSDVDALAEQPDGGRSISAVKPTPSRSVVRSKKPLSPSSDDASRLDLARKLPYRPNQQVEFLNLQVETEALLHQIYLQTRQRQRDEQSPSWELATSSCS